MPPPMIPFLLSWMILHREKTFEGNLNAGYLAQSGNTKSSSLTADTAMTGMDNVPLVIMGQCQQYLL